MLLARYASTKQTINLNSDRFNDDWKRSHMQFQLNKTVIDRLLTILFNSECMAKLLMDIPQ